MRSLGKDNEEKVSKVYHASYSAKAQGKKKKKNSWSWHCSHAHSENRTKFKGQERNAFKCWTLIYISS